jgi:hypothetical protein
VTLASTPIIVHFENSWQIVLATATISAAAAIAGAYLGGKATQDAVRRERTAARADESRDAAVSYLAAADRLVTEMLGIPALDKFHAGLVRANESIFGRQVVYARNRQLTHRALGGYPEADYDVARARIRILAPFQLLTLVDDVDDLVSRIASELEQTDWDELATERRTEWRSIEKRLQAAFRDLVEPPEQLTH